MTKQNEIVDIAIESKPENKFNDEAKNLSYVSFLPYLGLRQPHPMAGIESDDILDAKEVYEFFRESFPDAPFKAFMEHLKRLPTIPTRTTKIKQVLNYVRLWRLSLKDKKPNRKLRDEARKL